MGLGNPHCGDDALGIVLARGLQRHGFGQVSFAGIDLERWLRADAILPGRQVVFLDAVEIRSAPGTVVLLDADQVRTRFPQVSTHRLALGMVARLAIQKGATQVWLLGIQPESLHQPGLSPVVQQSVDLLLELLVRLSTSTRPPLASDRKQAPFAVAAPPLAL